MTERAREDELAIDAQIAGAYRAAATQLNEAPSPVVRATVLAAAARAVQAKPTGVSVGGGAAPLRGTSRYRVPLAAAASVLVGTVALLMAQRTEMEMPATEAMLPSAAPPEARAPATELVTRPDQRGQDEAQREGKATLQAQAVTPRQAESAAPSAPESPPRAAATAKPAPGTVMADDRHEVERMPQVSPSSARSPGGDTALTAARGAVKDAARDATTDVATSAAKTPMTLEQAAAADIALPKAQPGKVEGSVQENVLGNTREVARESAQERVVARPVQRSAPINGDAGAAASDALSTRGPDATTMANPQRWAERIIALRAMGRHDIADAELQALRARYPDFPVPASAQRAP